MAPVGTFEHGLLQFLVAFQDLKVVVARVFAERNRGGQLDPVALERALGNAVLLNIILFRKYLIVKFHNTFYIVAVAAKGGPVTQVKNKVGAIAMLF